MDERAEGVYCSWESYPPNTPGIENNLLLLERVTGNGTVETFTCTRDETQSIMDFLASDHTE